MMFVSFYVPDQQIYTASNKNPLKYPKWFDWFQTTVNIGGLKDILGTIQEM